MAGKFIVLEGLDGAGITTQATLLRNYFLTKNKDVILTKEPTEGLMGGLIKSCLRNEWKTDPLTLQMLFAADRSHHLSTEIDPAIKNNKMVICDRYILSSLAFGSTYISLDILKQLNINFRKPNLTIVVDTHPNVCIERMKKARHHVEMFEEEQKLEQIRRNYISLKNYFSEIVFVDGNRSAEEVFNEIKKLVESKI
ncbi:MAG: dTMP kinase [Candidatus Aenigmarchaeota archaeon]|nr:dTMP kinase [Candidatus Aenigmarchaeota archaeon]